MLPALVWLFQSLRSALHVIDRWFCFAEWLNIKDFMVKTFVIDTNVSTSTSKLTYFLYQIEVQAT